MYVCVYLTAFICNHLAERTNGMCRHVNNENINTMYTYICTLTRMCMCEFVHYHKIACTWFMQAWEDFCKRETERTCN